MTFAAPLALAVAGIVAASIVALHFLARARPRQEPFPTARFIPDTTQVHSPSRSRRPRDVLLLLLRVATILLAGLAVAGPRRSVARSHVPRVVVLDRSRAVADPRASTASASAELREGDVLVRFDSAATVEEHWKARPATDSATPTARPRGSLSAALVEAIRAGTRLRRTHDSVELVLVSPIAAEEWDEATARIAREWPSAIRVIRTAARASPDARTAPRTIRGATDDPLRATLSLTGGEIPMAVDSGTPRGARVVRDRPTAQDSAWARSGGVLVWWPADPESTHWLGGNDTASAVIASGVTVVAPFPMRQPPVGFTTARWVNGAPAATEHSLGTGCERDVAIAVPSVGDLALRPSMRALLAALTVPCGGAPKLAPLADSMVRSLSETHSRDVMPTQATDLPSVLTRWLLAAILALLVAELFLRKPRAAT
jgi:hypothetical protein